jgi:hypothetical protein
MTETFVNVTEGSGKKLHHDLKTIGANDVLDEYVLPGEYALASYFVSPLAAVSVATANDHALQIMAGSSLKVRIRRIRWEQNGNATTGAIGNVELFRLTSAGTGGTAVTPRPFDTSDAAAGCTAMTLPTAKGTEGVLLARIAFAYRQTVATSGAQTNPVWEWTQLPGTKPLIIPAGTTNGIALKVSGNTGATVIINVELVETSF